MTDSNDETFLIIWRYRVRPEHIAEFERAYGPDGEWVELFRRGDGYLGTQLVRGATPESYATIDRWVSGGAHARFLDRWSDEYAALDRRFERLTDDEHPVIAGGIIEGGVIE